MWRHEKNGWIVPAIDLEGVNEPYNLPRQALPEILWHTGQIDIIRTKTLLDGSMTGKNIHAIDVPTETAIDIDTTTDFVVAEAVCDERMPAALKNYFEHVTEGKNQFANHGVS